MGRILITTSIAVSCLLWATNCTETTKPNCEGVNTDEGYDEEDIYSYKGRDMNQQSDWDVLMRSWRGCKSLPEVVFIDKPIENFDELGRNTELTQIKNIDLQGLSKLTSVEGFKNITGPDDMKLIFLGNERLNDVSAFSKLTSLESGWFGPEIDYSGFGKLNSVSRLHTRFHRDMFTKFPNLSKVYDSYWTTTYGLNATKSAMSLVEQLEELGSLLFICFVYEGERAAIASRIETIAAQHNLTIQNCRSSGDGITPSKKLFFNGCGAFENNPGSLNYYLTGDYGEYDYTGATPMQSERNDLLPTCPEEIEE